MNENFKDDYEDEDEQGFFFEKETLSEEKLKRQADKAVTSVIRQAITLAGVIDFKEEIVATLVESGEDTFNFYFQVFSDNDDTASFISIYLDEDRVKVEVEVPFENEKLEKALKNINFKWFLKALYAENFFEFYSTYRVVRAQRNVRNTVVNVSFVDFIIDEIKKDLTKKDKPKKKGS